MPKRPSAPGEFPCTTCGKRFSRRPDLQRHVQGTHERTRTYQCLFCHYATPQEANCVRHMRTVHGKPNQVPLLLLKFEIPASLTSSASTSRSTTPGSSFSFGSLPGGFHSAPNFGLYPHMYMGDHDLPASGSSTPHHLPLARSHSAPAQLSRYTSRSSPYPLVHTARPTHLQRHSMPEIASPAHAVSAPQPRSLSVGASPAAGQSAYVDPLLEFFGLPQDYAPTPQPTLHTTYQESPAPSAPPPQVSTQLQKPDIASATAMPEAAADISHMTNSQTPPAEALSDWATFEDLMQQGLPSLEELTSSFHTTSCD